MTKIVSIENLQTGMKIASAVINKYGQVLLPKGADVENRHKFMLKTWGITSVNVMDEHSEEAGTISGSELQENARQELTGRMKWIPRNPFEEDLLKAGIQVLLQMNNQKK